jgi:hypothetical protein
MDETQFQSELTPEEITHTVFSFEVIKQQTPKMILAIYNPNLTGRSADRSIISRNVMDAGACLDQTSVRCLFGTNKNYKKINTS